MRAFIRSVLITVVAVLGTAVLALGATLSTAVSLSATTALIMGGTGRPNPDDFPGYTPNVARYYIYPHSLCDPGTCVLDPVTTPETAWPLYGGADALTWRDSVTKGVEDFDDEVQPRLAGLDADNRLVLFGYSQSGAILAFEKQILDGLTTTQKSYLEIVVIGDVSRPNGGLNSRMFPLSIPVVEFPFGPPMPTDTGIKTTDIALRWDIIADAPLYATNALAMTNALLGFWYVHGTYPNPTQADPEDTPGGYTTEQWQWLMDHPEKYPDLVTVQDFGDTTYITVKPTVLPLVQPLRDLGLAPLANLLEPALRVLVEETGYDRSIPYGQHTPFQLIPRFNPVTLAVDVAEAVPQGVEQMMAGLRGEPTHVVPAPPDTLPEPVTEEETPSAQMASVDEEIVVEESDVNESDAAAPAEPKFRKLTERTPQPRLSDAEADEDTPRHGSGTDNGKSAEKAAKAEQKAARKAAKDSDTDAAA